MGHQRWQFMHRQIIGFHRHRPIRHCQLQRQCRERAAVYPYVLDWIKRSEDGIVLLREQDDAGFVYVIKPDPNGLKAQFRTVSKPDEAPVGASPQELLGGADGLQAKKCASLPRS